MLSSKSVIKFFASNKKFKRFNFKLNMINLRLVAILNKPCANSEIVFAKVALVPNIAFLVESNKIIKEDLNC